MPDSSNIVVRRIYDPKTQDDGVRVLVDRVWPRGMTKVKAGVDEWCKDVSPSTQLRTWYGHDPAKFEEFAGRYEAELGESTRARAFAHLGQLASTGRLTLLTATRAVEISEAKVLADLLKR